MENVIKDIFSRFSFFQMDGTDHGKYTGDS